MVKEEVYLDPENAGYLRDLDTGLQQLVVLFLIDIYSS